MSTESHQVAMDKDRGRGDDIYSYAALAHHHTRLVGEADGTPQVPTTLFASGWYAGASPSSPHQD